MSYAKTLIFFSHCLQVCQGENEEHNSIFSATLHQISGVPSIYKSRHLRRQVCKDLVTNRETLHVSYTLFHS